MAVKHKNKTLLREGMSVIKFGWFVLVWHRLQKSKAFFASYVVHLDDWQDDRNRRKKDVLK